MFEDMRVDQRAKKRQGPERAQVGKEVHAMADQMFE
jgi:hypothetical protein